MLVRCCDDAHIFLVQGSSHSHSLAVAKAKWGDLGLR